MTQRACVRGECVPLVGHRTHSAPGCQWGICQNRELENHTPTGSFQDQAGQAIDIPSCLCGVLCMYVLHTLQRWVIFVSCQQQQVIVRACVCVCSIQSILGTSLHISVQVGAPAGSHRRKVTRGCAERKLEAGPGKHTKSCAIDQTSSLQAMPAIGAGCCCPQRSSLHYCCNIS